MEGGGGREVEDGGGVEEQRMRMQEDQTATGGSTPRLHRSCKHVLPPPSLHRTSPAVARDL